MRANSFYLAVAKPGEHLKYRPNVRVTVLSKESAGHCGPCVLRGGSILPAAYLVAGVRACRKHLATLIDAVSAELTTAQDGAGGDRPSRSEATSLNQFRLKHQRDLKLRLEKLGIIDIPDPD